MTASTISPPGADKLPALLGRLAGDAKHEVSAYGTWEVIWALYGSTRWWRSW
jgi:hypothetical protein